MAMTREQKMRLAAGQAKAAEAKKAGMGGAAPPAPTPADLAAVIQAAVAAAVAPIAAELEALKKSAPQFRDVPVVPKPIDPGAAAAGMRAGEERAGGAYLPQQLGRPLSESEVRHRLPRYEAGSTVRINRAAPSGAHRLVSQKVERDELGKARISDRVTEPLTWGEVLDKAGVARCVNLIRRPGTRKGVRCGERYRIGEPCAACGNGPRVHRPLGLDKDEVWKYGVVVPGLTGHQYGNGFREYELEPA